MANKLKHTVSCAMFLLVEIKEKALFKTTRLFVEHTLQNHTFGDYPKFFQCSDSTNFGSQTVQMPSNQNKQFKCHHHQLVVACRILNHGTLNLLGRLTSANPP